jgi:hypothetical protein
MNYLFCGLMFVTNLIFTLCVFQGLELTRSVNEAGVALQYEEGTEESKTALRGTMTVCYNHSRTVLILRLNG